MTGRPETPLGTAGALGKLAQQLRLLREGSALTYREMAAKTQISASTLSRAADGTTLPRWETVSAYAQTCGADPARTRPVWERASAENRKHRSALRVAPQHGPSYPDQVSTVAGLARALQHLRRRAGQPSLLTLERITTENGERLPRSTASDLLRANLRSPRLDRVLALARACGESEQGLLQWREAWVRATNPELARVRRHREQQEASRRPRPARSQFRRMLRRYDGPLPILARAMGITVESIEAVAQGKRATPEFVRDFARATGIPAEELFTDLGWLPPPESGSLHR